MRSTHDHEDRIRYWLNDPVGGVQPIPDKIMVMSRWKSKVHYCFIKLLGISFTKLVASERITAFLSLPTEVSLA